MSTSLAATLLAALLLAKGANVVPDDARLEPVKARLQQALDRATSARLPSALLESKVKEGLAKGVPAERIASAVESLLGHLEAASALAQAHGQAAPSPRLLKALAEARLSGLEEAPLKALLAREGLDEGARTQAIETLSDLHLRGYEATQARPLVEAVLSKDPKALPRLAGAVEQVRRSHALTAAEATFAVTQGLQAEASLDRAAVRAARDAERANPGRAVGKAAREDDVRGRGVEPNPGKGKGQGRGKD